MRRIAEPTDGERGGIAVVVAILMVVLLGFAAISIDVAKLYSERAQLQNGADAAALMVARACATAAPGSDCSSSPSDNVRTLVRGNAVDGLSNVDSITVDTAAQTVQVTTGAEEAGSSPNSVSMFFAGILGFPSAKVTATSSVQWGTPSKGPVILPLAIAECKFKPLDPATGRGVLQELELGKHPCSDKLPGGFGWIQDTNAGCGVSVASGHSSDAGIWLVVNGDNGASEPTECSVADFSRMNDQTVLFPIYDVATGNGSNGKYYIKGFAAFHVTGYKFPKASWPSSAGTNKTIKGYFVKFVSLSQALELGSAPDYGASVVKLTS